MYPEPAICVQYYKVRTVLEYVLVYTYYYSGVQRTRYSRRVRATNNVNFVYLDRI